jgi:hypothetical protein
MAPSQFSLRMVLLHLFTVTVLCSLQSTLWVRWLGQIPGPQLWLCWLVFYSLYRPYFEALFVSYFFGVMMTPFTSLGLGLIWPSFFVLVTLLSYARNRVFWPGLRYYVGAVFIAAFFWHFVRIVLSRLVDAHPVFLMLPYRSIEIVMTFLASPFVFILLKKIENIRPQSIEKGKDVEAPA